MSAGKPASTGVVERMLGHARATPGCGRVSSVYFAANAGQSVSTTCSLQPFLG
jgi:hypothetical protein